MTRPLVHAIQRYFPQIYLACHVDHVRTKSNQYHLSAHDSMAMTHLDETHAMSPGDLARHLGVAKSTLSPVLLRLERLGYICRRPGNDDKRRVELLLLPAGSIAMSKTSVLDGRRIAEVLKILSAADQRKAVDGLAIFASAARDFQTTSRKRKRW